MIDSISKIIFLFPHSFGRSYGVLSLLFALTGNGYAQTETDTHELNMKDDVPHDSIRMELMPLMPDESYNNGLAPNLRGLALSSQLTDVRLRTDIPHDAVYCCQAANEKNNSKLTSYRNTNYHKFNWRLQKLNLW